MERIIPLLQKLKNTKGFYKNNLQSTQTIKVLPLQIDKSWGTLAETELTRDCVTLRDVTQCSSLLPSLITRIYITQIRRLAGWLVGWLLSRVWRWVRSDEISQIKHFIFQELDAVNKLITDGKAKANDIRNNLKNLETTSTRFVVCFNFSLALIEWSNFSDFQREHSKWHLKALLCDHLCRILADFYLFCGDNFEWHSKPQTSSTCAL